MKVLRQMTAGILAGMLIVNTAVMPAQAAVYVGDEEGKQEPLCLEEGAGQEQVDGSLFQDGNLENQEDGALEQGQPKEEEDESVNEAAAVNPNIPANMDVEQMDQAELDRALKEGWVEFTPNEENFDEMEPRAGIAGGDLVATATREVGVSGRPNKYTYWLGAISGTYAYAWCHAFVSWCGAQAGAGDQIPRTASCFYGAQEFKARGQWQNRISGYVPKSGDIIYFDWNADGGYDHVGIVSYVSGGQIHTVEGNAGDAVRVDGGRTGGYSLTDSQIIGYGVPNYGTGADLKACVDSVEGGNGCVQIKGWAFDRKALSQALDIRVYVGGAENSGASLYTIKADKERKDVNNVYSGVGDFHGFEETIPVREKGTQSVYVYASYAAGGTPDYLIGFWTVEITSDTSSPTIKSIKVSNISAEGYTVTCKVSDNVGVEKVMFPSWHESQTGDQAVWFEGTVADGVAECFISIEQMGSLSGSYITHIYAYDAAGNYGLEAVDPVSVDLTSLGSYKAQNLSTDFDALIESESTKKALAVQDEDLRAVQETEELNGQVWVFRREGNNSYSIQSKEDGRYLSLISPDAGAEVMLAADGGAQLWKALGAGDNSYYLQPEGSENCVLTPNKEENSAFILDTFGGSGEQRFQIRKLSTNVKKIDLNPTEMTLTEIGKTETILTSIEPETAADEKIIWKSTDEKVASVDKKGRVTAVGNGRADITATTEDGSVSAACKVTVAVKVTSVSLNKQEIKLTSKGAIQKLSAAVTPDNAYDQTVTWNSSNQTVASVDQKGNVKAVKAGMAEITAQSADGEQKAVCKVTVQIPQTGAGGKVKSGQYTYSADFLRDASSCKTVIYRQKTGGKKTKLAQINAEVYLKLIYGGKLYYEKVASLGKRHLCALDIKTNTKQTVRSNAVVASRYGKRLLVMPYSAKTSPQACYVLNMANGKTTLISKKCMGGAITSSKVYYVEAVSEKPGKGWNAKVHSCKLTGAKDKCITGKITVSSCEKVTAKYVTYQSGKARYQYKYAGKKKTKL